MDTTNQRTATQDQILIDAVKEHLNTWNSSENFEFIINFTNRLAEIVNYSEFLRAGSKRTSWNGVFRCLKSIPNLR